MKQNLIDAKLVQVPVLQPFPAPHSVVVLDGCGVHKGAAFRAAIEACGAKLLFLPAYSPKYNPVGPPHACSCRIIEHAMSASLHACWP